MAQKPAKGSTGILSTAGSSLISIAAGILLLPLVVTSIGSSEYGVWLVLSAVAIYLQVSDLGIGASVVHFNSRSRGGTASHGLNDLMSAATLWNASIAVVVIPVFGYCAFLYLSSNSVRAVLTPTERDALCVLALLGVSTILLKPFDACLISQGWLPRERIHFATGIAVRAVGTISACLFAPSVVWVALAEVLGLLIPSLLSAGTSIRRGVHIAWSRDTVQVIRFMMSFSTRAFGAGALGMLILQGGTVMAGTVSTPSDATYFNAAFRVYQGVRQLISWTTQPFRSAQARLFASDRGQAQELLLAVSLSSILMAILASGSVILASPVLVELWLGNQAPLTEVTITIAVLLIGVIFNSVHGPFVGAGDAAGRPGAFVPVQALWLALFLGVGVACGARWGTVGVAVGLTAPLPLIEWIYLSKASDVLGFTIREWYLQVLRPLVSVFTLPAVFGAAFWTLKFAADLVWAPLIGSVIFFVMTVALLHRRRTRPEFRRLARIAGVDL